MSDDNTPIPTKMYLHQIRVELVVKLLWKQVVFQPWLNISDVGKYCRTKPLVLSPNPVNKEQDL